jgi:hypothetical protein
VKTRYGTRLVRDVTKAKEANYKRMREIALEIKKAKASDFTITDGEDHYYQQLEQEFYELLEENKLLQERINNICYLETFLED